MALKNRIESMRSLMLNMCADLDKLSKGNKTAAQRVRTNSLLFAKVAKLFRKESVSLSKKDFIAFTLKKK
jgi:hypothetical protein